MQYIKTYFPNLTPKQENQFMALGQLYTDWNAKINVISRKDIENLYLHHILHSLGNMFLYIAWFAVYLIKRRTGLSGKI